MIRRVAFSKAVLAGFAGAAAWEGAARLARLAGIPLFDLVRFLGTMPPGWADAHPWQWWPLGMALHALGVDPDTRLGRDGVSRPASTGKPILALRG